MEILNMKKIKLNWEKQNGSIYQNTVKPSWISDTHNGYYGVVSYDVQTQTYSVSIYGYDFKEFGTKKMQTYLSCVSWVNKFINEKIEEDSILYG
jgi:hypothetical protein|tara:strand:- start:493 stop:774 length:282 start_codon:yes stop_codon:yes gene_type:complete